MNEHNHQKLFISWMSTYHPNVLVFAIPNGGIRDSITAKKLKDEGVVAGIPDLFVADGKPGLFIEMKEPNGKLSKSQKEIIPRLELAGYPVSVCYGYEAAKKAVNKYLSSEAN